MLRNPKLFLTGKHFLSLYSWYDFSIRFQVCNGRPQMCVKELTTFLTHIKNLNYSFSTFFVTKR